MANIFITYGDNRFSKSIKRIKKQIRNTGLFDKIITYSPKDLPQYITASPLFAFNRGGGYWLWKPYIIYYTLQHCTLDDVVYYADAGCTVQKKSEEWNNYHELIKGHSAIFFQYRSDIIYKGWESYYEKQPAPLTAIKYWIKPSTKDYFFNYFKSDDFLDFNKIWGGFCIIKKNAIEFVKEWLNISLFHPELVMDPFGEELNRLPDFFLKHRHDQSIITPLLYFYRDKYNILILPESSESQKSIAAIKADRYRIGKMHFLQYFKYKLYNILFKNQHVDKQ